MTLEERKKLAIQYIKRALELEKSTTENFWGFSHWRMLSGAAYVIQPFCNTELRPYARLIVTIRKRWEMKEKQNCVLSDRLRYRLGRMTEQQANRYQRDCKYKNKSTLLPTLPNTLKTQELKRLAGLTL